MDRFAQLAVAAADQAADEAGLLGEVDPARVGVIVGTGVGGLTTLQAECKTWLEEGDRAVSPLFVPMMMPNAAAGQIAMRRGLHGPGFSIAVGLLDRRALDRRGRPPDRARRGRRDDLRRHRGGARRPLPGGLPAHGRAVARRRVAAVRHAPRRLRHGRGLRGPGAGARGARPRPRRADLRARHRLRRLQRRVPHHPARGERPRRRRGDDGRAARRRPRAGRRRLRQRARHEHADQRPRRDARPAHTSSARTGRRSPRARAPSGTRSAPPARSRRWPASRRCAAARCRRRSGSRTSTPSAPPTTSPARRARRRTSRSP